jgi:hypothetical protein
MNLFVLANRPDYATPVNLAVRGRQDLLSVWPRHRKSFAELSPPAVISAAAPVLTLPYLNRRGPLMLYDVTTITVQPGTTSEAVARLEQELEPSSLRGQLLACWLSDIGALNRILIIRGYADGNALEADRRELTEKAGAFAVSNLVAAVSMDTYMPFPFVEPMQPGTKAGLYEVRTYLLRPEGLLPTREAWRQALPERVKLSPLLVAMHTITGPMPSFIHIWPYRDLNERQRIRAQAVSTGVWPPRGGPGRLVSQQTDIYFPARFSPIG